MKQIKDLAWMSAIALAGTITFAACSSDDDKVQNINPTYDGKSVKTQFAINIPRAAQQTRQTAAITQNNSNFRGMDNIKLIPMKAQTVSGETTETFQDVVSLSNITTGIASDASNKVYTDVQVPVGTQSFLFYAKASEEIPSAATNGALTISEIEKKQDVNDINFTLSGIVPDNTLLTTSQTTLLDYLNAIVATTDWSTTDNANLINAYTKLTELKVCSSTHILKMMQSVYDVVKGVTHSNYTNLVNSIIENIEENGFTITEDVLSYTSTDEEVINFPGEFGLPEGAVGLTFSSQFAISSNVTSVGPNDKNVTISSVCYPSALYYFANTNLRANDEEIATSSLPKTPSAWNDFAWTEWDNIVKSSTQTIALKDNINYGVALLETTVKASNSNLQDKDNNYFAIGATDLQLTGVLVGGQPTKLGWDMLPTSDADYTQTVYDSQMNEDIFVGTANPTTKNYTLLLDNKMPNNATDLEKKVNVALELLNNSTEAFAGVDGIVPAGAKFYLIGQLDPSDLKNDTDNTDGTATGDKDRVFVQDHTTKANFTISSLKNAYVTIPDLRSTKLQLGLSVDLSWEAGLTFDVTID